MVSTSSLNIHRYLRAHGLVDVKFAQVFPNPILLEQGKIFISTFFYPGLLSHIFLRASFVTGQPFGMTSTGWRGGLLLFFVLKFICFSKIYLFLSVSQLFVMSSILLLLNWRIDSYNHMALYIYKYMLAHMPQTYHHTTLFWKKTYLETDSFRKLSPFHYSLQEDICFSHQYNSLCFIQKDSVRLQLTLFQLTHNFVPSLHSGSFCN